MCGGKKGVHCPTTKCQPLGLWHCQVLVPILVGEVLGMAAYFIFNLFGQLGAAAALELEDGWQPSGARFFRRDARDSSAARRRSADIARKYFLAPPPGDAHPRVGPGSGGGWRKPEAKAPHICQK